MVLLAGIAATGSEPVKVADGETPNDAFLVSFS